MLCLTDPSTLRSQHLELKRKCSFCSHGQGDHKLPEPKLPKTLKQQIKTRFPLSDSLQNHFKNIFPAGLACGKF